ncbi:serine hydrolase domain-containing protein [Aureimonas frigidaquae]|uniref:Beta-lactamase-related domain-containing protein n=1 Tax=Aureimonas frigidaquae TaxID=424757 RepID=A0A0P0Z146_9HYPH|nr:serine hydrolase [Aureimonas frigidaquae]BAT27574.1 hypothetical protein [Aureimonas frigidaquae]
MDCRIRWARSRRTAWFCLALAATALPSAVALSQEGPGLTQIFDGKLLPDAQVQSFSRSETLFPTRLVPAHGRARPVPDSARSLDGLSIASEGRSYDLFDYLSMNRVAGIMVLKDGERVFEDYELGTRPETRWPSMSMAAAITSTLVGAAIEEGLIARIDDPLTRYLPELAGTSYDGVTVRQLLMMSSGVKWNERLSDPASDRRAMMALQAGQEPGSILRYVASRPRAAEPGTVWVYSSGETQMLGALVAAATGRDLAAYLSDTIWSPAGMEADAAWWLESPGGLEMGGIGLAARLRDYARFGQFILEDGVIDGRRILPEGWVRQAGSVQEVGGRSVAFGYMWWPLSEGSDFDADGAFAAIGAFGQYIYVNPRRRVVIVLLGSQSKPEGSWPIDETDFLEAVARHLD